MINKAHFWYRNFNLVIEKAISDPFLHFIADFQIIFLLTPDCKQKFNRRFTEGGDRNCRLWIGQNQWIFIGNIQQYFTHLDDVFMEINSQGNRNTPDWK